MIRFFKKKFYQHQVYLKTVSELNRLTDREMQDIGLNGADVHYLATEASIEAATQKYGE